MPVKDHTPASLAAAALLAALGCSAAPPPPPPVAPPERPFLQRTAAPPAGVPAKVGAILLGTYFLGLCPSPGMTCTGGDGCRTEPLFQAVNREATLPEPLQVCVGGFPAGELLEVGLTGPDGKRHRRRVVAKDDVQLLTFVPEGPAGTVQLELRRGEGRLADAIVVRAPKEPTALVHPQRARPGAPLTLAVAGLPSGAARAHVYRATTKDADSAGYVGTLDLDVRSTGVAVLEIPTAPGDPAGDYQIRVEPGAVDATFELDPAAE